MSGRFSENPAYAAYESLTIRLHDLFAQGKTDSEEADDLRDQMDGFWKRLDAREHDRLDGLAIDLDSLTRTPGKGGDSSPDVVELDQARAVAYQRREWHRFLMLMRRGATSLAPDFVAFARSRAYQELGHPEVALLFMRQAAQLNPKDNYLALLLELLKELNQFDEAVVRAESIIANSTTRGNLLVIAGGVLFSSTRTMLEAAARPRYEAAIEALSRAVNSPDDPAMRDRDVRISALVLLGICRESLGLFDAADEAYDTALRLEPSSSIVQTAKKWLHEQRRMTESTMPSAQFRQRRYQLAEQAELYLQAA